MNINIWRYNVTIDDETVRSSKSFVSRDEGLRHIIDSAYALARTFSGGANTAVSQPLCPNPNVFVVLLHEGEKEVARFELQKIASDDSLINFKLNHPYLHHVLDAVA